MANETITREEMLLNAVATGEATNLEPITREEMFLAKLGGADVNTPTPITRKEKFLHKAIENAESGGSGGGEGGEGDRMTQYAEGNLTELYDENVTNLATNAFRDNRIIKQYVFPNVKTTSNGSIFQKCWAENISLQNATAMNGTYTFAETSYLKSVYAPNLESVGSHAFQSATEITAVDFPKLTTAVAYMFSQCGKLVSANLPSISGISEGMFRSCYLLESFDCNNKVAGFGNQSFSNCYSLKALILRRTDRKCTLGYPAAFTNCHHLYGTVGNSNPDGLKDGYIYVPRSLIEDYKVATNWTVFADQFRALEDWTVDGTTTGEMDWDKINGGAV